MSNPQTEDGFTRIANELLDAILRFPFSKRELNIMLAVIRKTYGYNKKADAVSVWQLSVMTGIDRANISRAVQSMIDRKILLTMGKGRISHGVEVRNIGINKRYIDWSTGVDSTPVPIQHRCQNDNMTDVVLAQGPMPKRQPQKTTPKDNKRHAQMSSQFPEFWSAYPKKKSKGDAEKAWTKINPGTELVAKILEALENAKRSRDWIKDNGQYVPYPATWLRAKGWEDEFEVQSERSIYDR